MLKKNFKNIFLFFPSIIFLIKNFIFIEIKLFNDYKIFFFNILTKKKLNNKKFLNYLNFSILYHWTRIKFRGKGFRIRKFKNINKFTFNFGLSHWSKLLYNNNFFYFKKIKKQNYILISKYFNILFNLKNNLKIIKKINSYTKRGLRLKKQYIKKRFGKISQVVSSLH